MSVTCVGLATLDVIHRCDRLPAPGTKGWAEHTELAAGGPAANAAVTAAHLLGRATLVTALGRGPAADVVRADLARRGVDVVDLDPGRGCDPGDPDESAAAAGGDAVTPVASCVVTADGERTVVSPGARTSHARLDAAARDAVRAARVVLVDGHHPAAGEEALEVATGLTLLDAGSAKAHVEPWLARLDVVAGSADYARGLGLTLDAALAHALDAGARAAVMTDGAAGARWATRSARGEVPVPQVDAVDTLGAGDAFHGALAAALALGRDLPDAAAAACAVATVRVQHAGARAWLARVEPWA